MSFPFPGIWTSGISIGLHYIYILSEIVLREIHFISSISVMCKPAAS